MNLLIILYLLAIAPKLLLDRVLKGKRHPAFLQRLGFSLPAIKAPLIWIHAVSVGEVKAALPLFLELKKRHPNHFFFITTTTATGQAEAKRSIKANAFAYLPIDLSWVVRKWVKHLQPETFYLVESDFWPNLLKALRRNQTKIILASAKMSARSFRRFSLFPNFTKRLFSHFDYICVQNQDHHARFAPFTIPSRLHITGNLKLDLSPQPTRPLTIPTPAITISCTHPTEEESLLTLLLPTPYFLILAPRHPERFKEVAQLLTRKNIPFTRLTDPDHSHSRVLLIDTMGQLPSCYAASRLAIVAGSFVTHIGGHNVLEPCLYSTPVLFGPHMQGQAEFATRVINAKAGFQVPLSDLTQTIANFFSNPAQEKSMRASALALVSINRGAAERTLSTINKL